MCFQRQAAILRILRSWNLLGELTRVVKEFTEILAREERKVFIHFPREEKGQMHRVALAPKSGGFIHL